MPLDNSVEQQISTDDNGLFRAVLSRIPENECRAFSGHQMEVLKAACKGLRWGEHAVDIRLSIPTFLSRYYLVLLAGEERRMVLGEGDFFGERALLEPQTHRATARTLTHSTRWARTTTST